MLRTGYLVLVFSREWKKIFVCPCLFFFGSLVWFFGGFFLLVVVMILILLGFL